MSFVNLALFVSGPLAHGVRGRLYRGPCLGVEVSYTDGSPVAYARVKVLAAGDGVPLQTGVTDRAGRFLFAPSRRGPYRVVVDDGQGHHLEMELRAGKPPPPRRPVERPGWREVLSGLGLIWLFFAALRALLERLRAPGGP